MKSKEIELKNTEIGWEWNVRHWSNQVSNSKKHLERLKKTNLSSNNYNVKKETEYLKECEVKLAEAVGKLKN